MLTNEGGIREEENEDGNSISRCLHRGALLTAPTYGLGPEISSGCRRTYPPSPASGRAAPVEERPDRHFTVLYGQGVARSAMATRAQSACTCFCRGRSPRSTVAGTPIGLYDLLIAAHAVPQFTMELNKPPFCCTKIWASLHRPSHRLGRSKYAGSAGGYVPPLWAPGTDRYPDRGGIACPRP